MGAAETSAALGILRTSRQGSPSQLHLGGMDVSGPAPAKTDGVQPAGPAGPGMREAVMSLPGELEALPLSATQPLHAILNSSYGLPAALPAAAGMDAFTPFQHAAHQPATLPMMPMNKAQLQPLLFAMLTADLQAPLARSSSADSSVGSNSPPAAKNNALYKVIYCRVLSCLFSSNCNRSEATSKTHSR
jgi:hypothetical protein